MHAALLGITTDPHTFSLARGERLILPDRFRLTLCDAAAWSSRSARALPLATLDQELCAAATALAVRVPLLSGSEFCGHTTGSKSSD